MATVGLLTTSYPRHEGDVAGLFVRGFARALVSRGHRVEVLAPEPREPSPPPTDEGVEIVHVHYAPRWLSRTFYGAGVPDNVRRDPRAWPGLASFPGALERAARERVSRWDALVSHWALPCALVAGRVREDRPHLAVLHSADVHLMRRLPLRSHWAEAVGASATQLLFSSAALRGELLGWVPPVPRADLSSRSHVSAMGIDAVPLPGRRDARKATGASDFVVLAMGRLVPIKGLAATLDALASMASVELWIAGEGPERRALEAKARERGARARFFGTVTGERKAELFAAADALILPSRRERGGRTEGLPTILLEAASAGLPIVASDVGGIGEVFENERNALLIPPSDAFALRHALERLLDDRALRRRLGRAAHTVGRRYLWPELAPHIDALLFGA